MRSFKGVGGHHAKVPATVEWLTPPELILALGGWQSFDRDPCAPIEQPYPTARATWTILDDGLSKRWDPAERFLLNPPYTDGEIEKWLSKLNDHGNGTALIFARTDTDAFHRYAWEAHAALFMRGRVNFHYGEAFSIIKTRETFQAGDRAPKNSGAPSVLLAFGEREAERLAESGVDGKFIPLIVSRSVLVSALVDVTWRELIVQAMESQGGTVSVEAVWRVIRVHPKAAGREHARAKVRQILQVVGERIDRGQYRLAV